MAYRLRSVSSLVGTGGMVAIFASTISQAVRSRSVQYTGSGSPSAAGVARRSCRDQYQPSAYAVRKQVAIGQ